MSKRNDRLKRLARRAEYLEKRIAGGVVSGKDLTWDKGEASTLRFVLKHIKDLEADLAAAREEIARRAEDTARMDAVENLKLTVQHRSGITASVHPWMVRGDVGAWTGRSAREVVDAARAGGTR